VATYTAVDASSIDDVRTYSDSGLTQEVEDITSAVVDIGVGLYSFTQALTFSLYTVGVLYYLKVTYTPSGAAQRVQSFPFYVFPAGQPASVATVTDTDFEGFHLQAPALRLRLGSGAFRNADLSNRITPASTRNRYEADFLPSDTRKGKILHLVIYNIRAGEPWALQGVKVEGTDEGATGDAGN
jgi:hypothetical protein